MEKSRIARVRLLSAARAVDKEFDYLCPENLPISRGSVVKIPFGKANRICFGIVTSLHNGSSDIPLKTVIQGDESIRLTEELLSLCEYLSEQIFCSFGEAAKAILPSSVYRKNPKTERIISPLPSCNSEDALSGFRGKNKEKYREFLTFLNLRGSVPEKNCRELFGFDRSHFLLLQKKGLISFSEEETFRDPFDHLGEVCQNESSPLSPHQQKAFDELKTLSDSKEACAALLHGVTGSGKTRVMLALCDHVLAQGKSVVFLVPEIALTGQSARLLRQRYGKDVAIFHSALSEGEKRDSYLSILSGKKRIVLGTRSAIFAPVSDLGLIIIDEEQDQSYKSDTQLKYHARDVARFRCAKNKAMLLLASATPDIESYYKAKSGIYSLVELKERYGNATLPPVKIIDLRPDLKANPSLLLGKALREEIRKNLEAQEQTILLMNRRGYRRFLSCLDCGSVLRCPHCSVSLTVHNGASKHLSCHYCGYTIPLPNLCPECQSKRLIPHGYGIQQLEEELSQSFPQAKVLRLDSDSLTGKNAHERILEAFRNREADILIGTQMVAKGHNFPNVTLVGIVMADSSLYLSDFRAGEHTFSLLTQVIGRAGRSEKKGRALIQTLNPYHNVFSLSAQQDFSAFYEGEIALRKAFQFPPFCQLALFTVSDENEENVLMTANAFGNALKKSLAGAFSDVKLIVYGPFEAPIYRLKNIYRKRFIIKYKNNSRSRALFDYLLTLFSDPKKNGATITTDIGPGTI